MASKAEVNAQLDRLHSLFVPLHPVKVDGKPNERHIAMRSEYIRCLEGFTAHELEMGFDDICASWKYRGWPSAAECANACRPYTSRNRPKRLPHMKPADPEEEFSEEHRLLMRRGLRNCARWMKTGEILNKTPADGLVEPCDDIGIERALAPRSEKYLA